MAITSAGYYGTVNDVQWAQTWEDVPRWFRPTGYVPSAVTGQRRVAVSAGVAFAAGIRDTNDAVINTDLTPPSSGGQWWLLVLRRTWAVGIGGTTTVVALAGATTDGTAPTDAPATVPAGFQASPADRFDAPIVWAHVRAADTTLTLFDVRILTTGTGVAAATPQAVRLLAALGTLAVGQLVPSVSDGITYKWISGTWKPWDSDWVTSLLDIYGLSGAYNASPGWVISKMEYRWVSGQIRFHGQFSINGGGTSNGQLGVRLPIPAAVGVFNRPIGNCVAQNNSDSNSLAVIVPIINGTGTAAYFSGHRVNAGNASRLEPINGSIPFGEPQAQSDEFQFDFTYAPA